MTDKLSFLFWNIHKSTSNVSLITQYGASTGIDIIALCETPPLTEKNYNGYTQIEHIDDRNDISIFIRKGITAYYTRERKRYSLFRIESELDFNIAVAHLNSDYSTTGKDYREGDIEGIRKDLETEEAKYSNKNSLIIGDLNDDPFSEMIIGWNGFNVVFFKHEITVQGKKLHDEQKKDYFYSPMLHLIRDNEDKSIAKGTYYYGRSKRWLYYDQVLMKYPLAQRFDLSKFTIISKLGETALVKDNHTICSISDHVPLFFEITMMEEE